MDITVLCPGIRTENWQKLYNSIDQSFTIGTWEIIFISPYLLPDVLELDNVKIIKSMASPIVCQQMGLVEAKGDYITWAADDGVFVPGALDIAHNLSGKKDNTIVMGKYIEGGNDGAMCMAGDDYYILNKHDGSLLPHHNNTWMLNVGLVPRQMLLGIGGWDCRFEVCPMAYNDLAVRLQNDGVEFIIQNEIMYTCDHMPGETGDHKPIHNAQIKHDQPLFRSIYCRKDSVERKAIPFNNYKDQPERWIRRFGSA